MPAIIALILANLPLIISTGEAGFKFIASIRTAAKQSGEWTDEVEAQFQHQIGVEELDPAWHLDVTDQAEPTAPAPAIPLGTFLHKAATGGQA